MVPCGSYSFGKGKERKGGVWRLESPVRTERGLPVRGNKCSSVSTAQRWLRAGHLYEGCEWPNRAAFTISASALSALPITSHSLHSKVCKFMGTDFFWL